MSQPLVRGRGGVCGGEVSGVTIGPGCLFVSQKVTSSASEHLGFGAQCGTNGMLLVPQEAIGMVTFWGREKGKSGWAVSY